LQQKVLTQEQLRDLRTRIMIEILADTFEWKWSLITWVGHKPANPPLTQDHMSV